MNRRMVASLVAVVVLVPAWPGLAKEPPETWLAMTEKAAAKEAQPPQTQPEAPPGEPPPLPFHTIEGYGGACITPMAYLVNPGKPGTIAGMPSTSFTFVQAGKKNVEVFAVTETFWRRIELGYAINRFDMGTLPSAIKKATGTDIERHDVYLHNFNVRAMLLEENSFNLPLPAVTAGAHFKYNDGIRSIDNRLSGTMTSIGFHQSNGTDYTLTASKTLPIVFGRPVILSAGLRNSQASQIGYLGFGDRCATTFEGSVVYLPLDWLAVGYEFRQKRNPYDRIANLVGGEDNWQTVVVGLIFKDWTLCVGWANLGNLANSDGTGGWAIQFKYEF
jgi:hypothetical protein